MFCYKNRYIHVRTGAPALIRCGRTMCFVRGVAETSAQLWWNTDRRCSCRESPGPTGWPDDITHAVLWDVGLSQSGLWQQKWAGDLWPTEQQTGLLILPIRTYQTVTQRSSCFYQRFSFKSNENEEVFGICSSTTASFSSSFIRPDKRFLSWCNICSTRRLEKSSGWKTSTKNHGCTDKVCINGTCRVIIL